MRIKHWQGYGQVTAEKVYSTNVGGENVIVIKVSGNHEWGLHRDDRYDVARWLLSKFVKEFRSGEKNYMDITQMILEDSFEKSESGYTEVCTYHIKYR